MLPFFSASSPYAFEDGVLIGLDEAAAMLEHFLSPLQLPLIASFLSGVLFFQVASPHPMLPVMLN